MAATRWMWVGSSVCLLLASLSQVPRAVAQGIAHDLKVLTVTRTWEIVDSNWTFTVTVNFIASMKPQTQWTYAGKGGETASLTDTSLRYEGNRGQATANFSVAIQMVTLSIGYIDTHVLELFIRVGFENDVIQTLNTSLSSVQPGYDISYTPGDSFQVVAFIPRHVADNFTWSHYLDDPEREFQLQLDACYVNQNPDRVLYSTNNVDIPDMRGFLQTRKVFGESGVRHELDFNTARETINGYFLFTTMSQHSSYRDDNVDQLVVEIWERIVVMVHEASIEGPFPDHLVYVGSDYDTEECSPGEECSIYCDGFANEVDRVDIFKVGSAEPFTGPIYINVQNSHHVSFHTHFAATGDYAGNYSCKVVSSEGLEAQTIVPVSDY